MVYCTRSVRACDACQRTCANLEEQWQWLTPRRRRICLWRCWWLETGKGVGEKEETCVLRRCRRAIVGYKCWPESLISSGLAGSKVWLPVARLGTRRRTPFRSSPMSLWEGSSTLGHIHLELNCWWTCGLGSAHNLDMNHIGLVVCVKKQEYFSAGYARSSCKHMAKLASWPAQQCLYKAPRPCTERRRWSRWPLGHDVTGIA
jgi:hypothetical protein